jgi:hypothetical protein
MHAGALPFNALSWANLNDTKTLCFGANWIE